MIIGRPLACLGGVGPGIVAGIVVVIASGAEINAFHGRRGAWRRWMRGGGCGRGGKRADRAVWCQGPMPAKQDKSDINLSETALAKKGKAIGQRNAAGSA